MFGAFSILDLIYISSFMNIKLICLFFCLLCSYKAFTQTTHRNEIGVQTDDDSYLAQGSDRYYSAGTFIYFRHALNLKDTVSIKNKVLGFEIGQKLYTPQSGSINFTGTDDPKYIDRPFAAYLYIGSTLNFLYANESSLKLGAQLGIIGPSAFGKQTQTSVHQLLGLYQPSGWEYQIENNAVLNLSAEYNRLLTREAWMDLSLNSYANLGNGFTGLGVGPLLRFGDFNELFNSLSTQSTAIQSKSTTSLHERELFFYYKPQFNFIVYDATVQGSLFGTRNPNSLAVTLNPERFVLSNQLGIGYSGKRFVIDVAAIFHSKDVKEMIQAHQWGSVTLLYRFN